jgi:hypothetical protein
MLGEMGADEAGSTGDQVDPVAGRGIGHGRESG